MDAGADAGLDAGKDDAGEEDAGKEDAGKEDGGEADAGPVALRILFIGDSYTYVNDLPGMLAQIAATSGQPPTIETAEVVQGGAALGDQWSNGIAQTQILAGGWSQVVLQGQSEEPLLPSKDYFLTYADMFGDLIVDAGARPTFFVTWARAAGSTDYGQDVVSPRQMQDELDSAYADAAQHWPDSLLVCAGEAFQRAIARYPAIVLQQNDFSHPTVAGTYLAAATFYVALTGNPVPAQSMVPAGLSTDDAANLRSVALIGSDCASAQVKGAVVVEGQSQFDFGTAGFAVSQGFELRNTGGMTVGLSDAHSLAAPFAWSGNGNYPGGSGASVFAGIDYCSDSLDPGSTCAISLTFDASSTGTGTATLDLTNAYLPTAGLALAGTATDRAFLTISDGPGAYTCTGNCGPLEVSSQPGATRSTTVYVFNRGALPVTALGPGAPLTLPLAWADGGFPGGVGSVLWDSMSYPYCSTGALAVGATCVATVSFSPSDFGTYLGTLSLAYSDSLGPVSPDASQPLEGDASNLPP